MNSNIHFKTLHNSTIGGFFKNEFYTIGSRNPDEWALLKWTDKEVKDGIFQEVAVLEKFDNDFLSSHFYKWEVLKLFHEKYHEPGAPQKDLVYRVLHSACLHRHWIPISYPQGRHRPVHLPHQQNGRLKIQRHVVSWSGKTFLSICGRKSDTLDPRAYPHVLTSSLNSSLTEPRSRSSLHRLDQDLHRWQAPCLSL